MDLAVSIILIVVFIISLVKLIIYHYKRWDLYKAGNKIPGPRPVLPIIGNSHLFMVHKEKFVEFAHLWLGTGLFTAPAKKWKVHRKLIMPTFHSEILESFFDTINKKSEILVRMMEPEINKIEFDILDYISHCVLDIVCATPRKKAFLDLLIELSDKGTLTEKEIYEEVDSMMVAANDTTSTMTSFVVFMLANFPNISPLKETMRLFPVAPFAMRNLADDLDIGGGYTLPKGSIVVLAFLKLQHSADFWDNPLSFDPDRFSSEQAVKRHTEAFFPFSAGLRHCPGSKYAMMSMKIIISNLLKNYVLIKDRHVNIEDIGIKPDIIIRASNPLTLKIKRKF
ncbi:cytochrome P450 4C1-like [Cotesia typhae]|uniref:cytochrome P450 4C1-like n=1 Tax=Cotesia typhae TaxID=2053667 RepID=UPI003D68A748